MSETENTPQVEGWETEGADSANPTVTEYCKKIIELRALKDDQKKILSDTQSELDETENKLLLTMEELGMKSLKTDFGAFSIREQESFTQPETMDDKLQLFQYLQVQGIFEEMVSVNSRTLSSWAKKEVEAKEQRGEYGWVPPGLKAPSKFKTLSVRK
jgi:hypothetical protein